MQLTDTQLSILCYLIDDEGHPLWEIARDLEIDEGYCSKQITKLKEMDMIYVFAEKKSTKWNSRSPNRTEYHLCINKKFFVLQRIQNGLPRKIAHHAAKVNREKSLDDNSKINEYGEPISSRSQILLNVLEPFQRWLDVTIQQCRKAGRDVRLDPKPLSYAEKQALFGGYGPYASPVK